MNPAKIVPFTFAIFFAITSLSNRMDAAAIIKVTESGGDVIISAAGSINISSLTLL